jgi:hypothetical protein
MFCLGIIDFIIRAANVVLLPWKMAQLLKQNLEDNYKIYKVRLEDLTHAKSLFFLV